MSHTIPPIDIDGDGQISPWERILAIIASAAIAYLTLNLAMMSG